MQTGPKENSQEWWNQRYQSKDFLYGKEPSAFLVEQVSELKKGKVLDVAMGEGRNAVYLANKGFEVEGIDFSEVALGRAEQLAKDTGVSVNIKAKDIDMFLMPLMTYDSVIICDYHPNLRFLKDINRGLAEKGVIMVDAYTTDQIKLDGPPVEFFECYKPNELLHNLKNVHVVFYQERRVDDRHSRVQCIARKTGLVS